jgi:hypothetical protein
MTFEQILERVRYEGAYPTRAQAEESARAVLAALGRQLTGDERVELAARLPHEAAVTFTSEIPATEPLTGWGFVKDLASRTGDTAATPAGTPVPSFASWPSSLARNSSAVSSPNSPPATPCCSAAPNSPRRPDARGGGARLWNGARARIES